MLKIKVLQQDFSICKITDASGVDFTNAFCFLSKTDEELSLVCDASKVPNNATIVDDGWNCFRIQGEMDFGLVGILAKIATLLADNLIPIFAISTYNTDYILVKKEKFEEAISILQTNGYVIDWTVGGFHPLAKV